MDTAAALQMAERVLSRHAQINSSFQASEPSACWPGARAQSAGMPGLVDILQRDSAAQRGSQGFEALDVQPLSRRPSGTYDSHLIHRPSSRPASRYSEQKARLQRRKVGCRRPAGRASTQGHAHAAAACCAVPGRGVLQEGTWPCAPPAPLVTAGYVLHTPKPACHSPHPSPHLQADLCAEHTSSVPQSLPPA